MKSDHDGDRINRIIIDGAALLRAGRPGDLLTLIKSVGPLGQDPRILAQKAYASALLGRIADALAAARQAMAASPTDLSALDLLGNAFTLCHQPEAAYAAFKRAQAIAPERTDVLLNLATAAGFLGRAEEAEQAYDRVIDAAPDLGDAYLNRSLLRRQTPLANHVSALRRTLDGGPLPWQCEVQLRYALGKELEDLGEFDGAFANIAKGAGLRRKHMRYAVADDIAAMELIASTHDERWCAPALTAGARDGPIFILGMPRSGTTLLERALGRHDDIQPLGELQVFGQALVATALAGPTPVPPGKEGLIRLSAGMDLTALRARYLSAVTPLRDDKARFTDKLPINFLYAGLIARAMPDATLIHLRRDPLDLCVAIFKTLFRDGYPFSYDLAELGAYHRSYQRLMDHWRRALGERMIEIDYEALVISPRETLETLLQRLGLRWQEVCLNPEMADTGVMTASAAQVRRPIHVKSVGSAARYRVHLDPLVAALQR